MLYFFMVAHKAACQTLSKAFLKSMKTWQRSCWCWRYFSQRMCRLKICSVVLLPALKPACSSVMIFSACGFNLFRMIFSTTLVGSWWGLLFGSSGTAAGCLSWEVWWLRTGSTGSPVHQVWPKPSCKAQWKGEEDKADTGRGRKITSGNGQVWNSPSPRGQWRTGKDGGNRLQNHL